MVMKGYMIAFAGVLALSGCALHDGKPRVGNFEVGEQNKLKSASHWQLVAQDVASQIVQRVPYQPIYIPSGTNTTFSKVFASQLKSSMLSKGYTLSQSPVGALHISVTVEDVQHVTLNRYEPGTLTRLAAGLLVLREFTETARQVIGTTAGLLVVEDITRTAQEMDKRPNTEIVLTTEATKDGNVVVHRTDVYYIDSVDTSLFTGAVTGRQFKVIGGAK
jgi:hypothetical protein